MAPLWRRCCDGTAAKVPRELTLAEAFRPVTSLAASKVNSRSTLVGARWAPTVVWVPAAWVPAMWASVAWVPAARVSVAWAPVARVSAVRVPVIWTSVV